MGETFQLYVKNTSNCEGLPLQTFELLGPTWTGDKIRLPFGEPPDVQRHTVVGWTDLFNGRPCEVSVARVRWLAHERPDVSGGPAETITGYLVWGGNSGVRILDTRHVASMDRKAKPTPGVDDHLPRGRGTPIIWLEDVADLPAKVRKVMGLPKIADCISVDGYSVFELPEPIEAPSNWVVREIDDPVFGQPYRVAEPPGLEPLGVPRPGYHPHFAPRRAYHWPWVRVRATREEAERDTEHHTFPIGAVMQFPIGGWWLWYHTGGALPPDTCESTAAKAMAAIAAAVVQ